MSGQKGSLKDRLRSWNLFLKYKFKLFQKNRQLKKKQKQMEKESLRKKQLLASGKYYSKPKVLGLTIVGLFFGIFESRKSKDNKLVNIEVKISKLENSLETISKNESISIIKDIKQDLVNIKTRSQFDNRIKNKIKSYEVKIEDIEHKIYLTKSNNHNIGKNLFNNKDNDTLKEKNIKDNKTTIQNIHNKVSTSVNQTLSEKADIKEKSETKIETEVEAKSPKGVYTPVLEIKLFNKEIEDYEKKVNKIHAKIKDVNNYNELYELEFSIKQLKIRFNNLLIKYNHLKDLPGFNNLRNILDIEVVDMYKLRNNEEMIIEQVKKCNAYLDEIETKKASLLKKQETTKVEVKQDTVKKEKKKLEEKKQEDKKIDNEISEVILANKIIVERLAAQEKNIAKFNRSISKMSVKHKKRSIFYYTKNLISSVFNFGLSLFPISLFKNKLVGGLASGIMINNSLRGVRRVLNPETEVSYILYSDFEKELNSTIDYLGNISYVCNDSLSQVRSIRETIYLQYGNDIEYSDFLNAYLQDLYNIENQILSQQEAIMNLQQQASITKKKNRQKVKKIQEINNNRY